MTLAMTDRIIFFPGFSSKKYHNEVIVTPSGMCDLATGRHYNRFMKTQS